MCHHHPVQESSFGKLTWEGAGARNHSSTWVGLGRTESVLNHSNIQVTGGSLSHRWPSDASGWFCLLYWFAMLMGISGWLLLFSHSIMSDFLWPYGLWHARLPCPSLSPISCSNSCPQSVIPSNHLILWHPLLLPPIFPSIRVFSNELALCIMWPNYWSFSFSLSPSNEYSGLISLGLTGLSSLRSKGLSRIFSNTTAQKY